MEKVTDRELLARIRRSDEEAFYVFCQRHWKTLYVRALIETSNKEEAFDRVSGAFAQLWDRRRELPELATTIEAYFFGGAASHTTKRGISWSWIGLMLNVLLGSRYLSINEKAED